MVILSLLCVFVAFAPNLWGTYIFIRLKPIFWWLVDRSLQKLRLAGHDTGSFLNLDKSYNAKSAGKTGKLSEAKQEFEIELEPAPSGGKLKNEDVSCFRQVFVDISQPLDVITG